MKRIATLSMILMLASMTTMPLGTAGPGPGGPVPGPGGFYEGPGTIVVGLNAGPTGSDRSLTLADNGAVVCKDTSYGAGHALGTGGICIPFHELGGDSIFVHDATYGPDVTFQVCVDANGDGICSAGGDGGGGGCTDIVIFSHSSFGGANFNPLFIPPHLEHHFHVCGSGGFPGYIVIMCAGLHQDAGATAAHTHTVDKGFVESWLTGGTPSGDFCGGPTAEKAYVVL